MASVTTSAGAPATGGKGKGKKSKGQKLDIDEFVDSSNFKMVDSSWADIMEDEDVISPSMHHVSLPSAPKSVQGPEIDFDAIPINGPFRANVANLQYEVNEDQLSELFTGLSVVNLRLNTENGRAQGTASVEFGNKQDLIEALNRTNKQLNGRAVRIYLPNSDRFGDRDGRRGGPRGSYVDNTPMNWRSADRGAPRNDDPNAPPKTVFPPPNVDSGFGSRGGSGRYGGDREGYRPPRGDFGERRNDFGDRRRNDDFGRREGGGGNRFRDDEGRSGNWGRGPRDNAGNETGGDNWRTSRGDAPPPQGDRDGFARRDNGRYGGGARNNDRDYDSMPPSRDSYAPRSGGGGDFRRGRDDEGYGRDREFDRRVPTPQGDDLYEQRRSGGDDYEPPRSFAPAPRERTTSTRSDRSNPDHDGAPAPRAAEEPRRSGPPALKASMIANILGTEEDNAKPTSYSSIFGSAKPIDTRAREAEIEKRLAEEKAAAAEKEAAAKEAAAAAAATASESGNSPAGSQVGESTRPQREHRGPRGDGTTPPPRMRRENGEGRGRDDRRHDRGGNRNFDDRNGGFDRRREGGGGPRPRMGEGGAGNRMGDRRRRDDRGEGYGFGGERTGERRYGGGDRRGDGNRYRSDNHDGPSDRYYRPGPGSGGRDMGDRDFERNRYISEGDDKEMGKNYINSNKYDALNIENSNDE